MFAPGTVVGDRYRLVRQLGHGGMGEVWEAVQLPLGRRVAVKTVLPELAADPSLLARFRREAETAAALGHPNIVQITDFFPGDTPFLVMELLEGETLKDVIEREGKLEPARVAFIGQQILSGLAAAHGAGVVHRDVKPANVFLSSTLAMRDIVKLVDFGLAKLVADAAPVTVPIVTRLGQVLGTVAYMAPEQASGAAVDHRADLYAVGATLFHAIAGVKPFDVIELGKPRARLSDVAPWIDRRLGDAIDRALAKRPEERWSSAAQMAEAIAPFAGRTSLPPGSGGDAATRLSAPTPFMNAAPTIATFGSSPSNPGPPGYAPTIAATPSGIPPSPVYPSYNPPPPLMAPPRPMPLAPPGTGFTPARVVLVVAALAVPLLLYAGWFLLQARRAAGAEEAAEVEAEKSFLATASLPPCPSPDRCTAKRADHDVTYPLCSGGAPSASTSKADDVLLVQRKGKTRIALVDRPGHARSLAEDDDFDLDGAQVVGRLCSVQQPKPHPTIEESR